MADHDHCEGHNGEGHGHDGRRCEGHGGDGHGHSHGGASDQHAHGDGGHNSSDHGHGSSHGHGHSHEGGGHECQHEHSEMESGVEERWLYDAIDTVNVQALNSKTGHGALNAIKPYDQRTDTSRWLESDADEQLLIKIPFTGSVKLKAFSLGSGPGEQGPKKIKAFIDRDDIDFDTVADMSPTQSWELARDNPVNAEHLFRMAKFTDVHVLTLFIENNYGADTTRIDYLAFKGIFTPLRSEPIVAQYELRPMPGDIRNKLDQAAMNNVF